MNQVTGEYEIQTFYGPLKVGGTPMADGRVWVEPFVTPYLNVQTKSRVHCTVKLGYTFRLGTLVREPFSFSSKSGVA